MVDVDDEDAADVKSAMLEGIALDEQILKATQGYPVYFHASMISVGLTLSMKSAGQPFWSLARSSFFIYVGSGWSPLRSPLTPPSRSTMIVRRSWTAPSPSHQLF